MVENIIYLATAKESDEQKKTKKKLKENNIGRQEKKNKINRKLLTAAHITCM